MRNVLLLTLGLMLAAPAGRALAQEQPRASSTDVDKLVSDLGADDFKKRDEAQKKLEAMGKKALPALEKAEKDSQDAEVRARAHEAILAIKKGRAQNGSSDKDEEREGPPLPPERRLAPPPQGRDEDSQDLDEFFKLFQGQQGQGGFQDMNKIFEHLRKQMQGLDEEFQKELKRPRDGNGGIRVFQFGMRPKTPVERKLGIGVNQVPPPLQAQLDLGTEGGVLVEEVAPNGPAWKAGLKLYDVILSVDGNAVRGPEDLKGLGEKDAKLEIVRKAKRETLVVHATTPDEAPKPDEPKKEEPQIRKF